MTQDDRMETITDPAAIRATDEPDERGETTASLEREHLAAQRDRDIEAGVDPVEAIAEYEEATRSPRAAGGFVSGPQPVLIGEKDGPWLSLADHVELARGKTPEWMLDRGLEEAIDAAYADGSIFSPANRDPADVHSDDVMLSAVGCSEPHLGLPCCTTPAPVGAAVALGLDALHETICDKFTGMAEVRQAADLLVAEVRSLRANWRMVTTALGYGDGITEPQIEHRDFVAECERQFAEASEWRESQRWRDECHEAGHPDDEDCYEHDPVLALVALRAKVAAAEALADQWADRKRSDGMSGNAWIGITLAGVAADLRAALATTGEGQ